MRSPSDDGDIDGLDRRTVRDRYGVSVGELDDAQLNALIGELEAREEEEDDPRDGAPGRRLQLGLGPSSAFDLNRTHVMEGVVCAPIHGGNRDFVGWRVVNYPGAHFVYGAEEQQVFEPLARPYQSVADL